MTHLSVDDATRYQGGDFARLDAESLGVVAEMCNENRDALAILRRAGFGGPTLVESVRLAVAETGRRWLP